MSVIYVLQSGKMRVLLFVVALSLAIAPLLVASTTRANGSYPSSALVTVWDTSSQKTITLPLSDSATDLDFTIDWGDATCPTSGPHTSLVSVTISCTFPADVTAPEISIAGSKLPIWNFSLDVTSVAQITDVAQWGNIRLGNDGGYFAGALNLDISATDAPELKVNGTTNLAAMFSGNTSLTNPDFTGWDTSSVTDFSFMFAADLTGDPEDPTVINGFNGDISTWDVSGGTSFVGMYAGAKKFNQNIGRWDVSNGTNFLGMFAYATAFDQNIGYWDVSNGTNFEAMFAFATAFNQNIGYWDVSNGTVFDNMFAFSTSFDQDISYWNLTNAVSFVGFGDYATSFNQNMSNWEFCASDPRDYAQGTTGSWQSDYRPTFLGGDYRICSPSFVNTKPAVRVKVDYVGSSGNQSYYWVGAPGTPTNSLPEAAQSELVFTGWFTQQSLINGEQASTIEENNTIAGFIPPELAQVLGVSPD